MARCQTAGCHARAAYTVLRDGRQLCHEHYIATPPETDPIARAAQNQQDALAWARNYRGKRSYRGTRPHTF